MILAGLFLMSEHPRKTLHLVKNAWWIATLVLAAVALLQFFMGIPPSYPLPRGNHFHVVLFFGHHLSTASIIIFPAFAALAQAIGEYLRSKTLNRFAIATASAGLLILFLSYARAVWMSAPIGIVILFFRYLKPKQRWLSISGLALALLIASQTSLMKDRLTEFVGITERFHLWQANIDFFKHNPLTGIGWLKSGEMSEFYFKQLDPLHYKSYFWGHAHSNFFEMLGGTGLIGVLAFIAWSIYTLKMAYRQSGAASLNNDHELSDISYGLGVALVLLHINGLTNVTFWEGKVMHQQMFAVGLLLVIAAINSSRARP